MKRSLQGRYAKVTTAGEAFKAFVPAPLPPRPAIDWSAPLRARFDAALVALGRLDAVTDHLPNAALLLYSFVRKEAVLSSMIEGTQSSLAVATGFTPATVNKALAHLQRLKVVAELMRKQRGRVFSYARYVAILNEGMALPGSGRRA